MVNPRDIAGEGRRSLAKDTVEKPFSKSSLHFGAEFSAFVER